MELLQLSNRFEVQLSANCFNEELIYSVFYLSLSRWVVVRGKKSLWELYNYYILQYCQRTSCCFSEIIHLFSFMWVDNGSFLFCMQYYSPKNTIMFDDLRRNFVMNPQNGLTIKPFRKAHVNRDSDQELVKLTQYLLTIAELDDLSTLNHSRWQFYTEDNAKRRRHAWVTNTLLSLSPSVFIYDNYLLRWGM